MFSRLLNTYNILQISFGIFWILNNFGKVRYLKSFNSLAAGGDGISLIILFDFFSVQINNIIFD